MAPPVASTGHEAFSHDSIDRLGYDWERAADPGIAPRHPLKVYLPRSTADVVQAVRECRELGQRLVVRSRGHSSNDLVLAERGSVLCTEKLDRILGIDQIGLTATVQAGAVLADLDRRLAERGLGLPIVGDHPGITAGGFASVGGVGPASHRHGLFVDNVRRLEYVDEAGEVVRCGRDERPDDFYRVLAGCGQHGVIATLTLDVLTIDKRRSILRGDRALFTRVESFAAESQYRIAHPSEAVLERGVWLDHIAAGRNLRAGQLSSYHETPPRRWKRLRSRLGRGLLAALGRVTAHLPASIEPAATCLGLLRALLDPAYASLDDIERSTDRADAARAGDPTRVFIVLAPAEGYADLFHRLYDLFREVRARTGCFTFLSVHVQAVRSQYLSMRSGGRFAEIALHCGTRPEKMTAAVLDELVSTIDDLCIETGALRSMHSRTVKDAERRRLIDPNAVRAASRERAPRQADGRRTARANAMPEKR